MHRALFLVLFLLLFPLASALSQSPPAAPGPPPAAAATVSVDCDAGDSVATALATRATELTIEISGTCAEELVVTRRQLTLRGADASATLTDDPSTSGPDHVLLLDAAGVVLENLTIDGASNRGIRAQRGSDVRLEGVAVTGSGSTGLTVEDGSSAHLVDSSFTGNGFAGVAAWGGSSLTLTGELDVSDNALVGVLVSTNSSLQSRGGQRIVAHDVPFAAATQIGATAQAPPLEASGNQIGLLAFGGSWTGVVDVSDAAIGILLLDGAELSGSADVDASGTALFLDEMASAQVGAGTLTAPIALSVRNSVVQAGGPTFDGEAHFEFNGQGFFTNATVTGGVDCDPSALVGGSISCPSSASGALRFGSQAAAEAALPVSEPFVQPE